MSTDFFRDPREAVILPSVSRRRKRSLNVPKYCTTVPQTRKVRAHSLLQFLFAVHGTISKDSRSSHPPPRQNCRIAFYLRVRNVIYDIFVQIVMICIWEFESPFSSDSIRGMDQRYSKKPPPLKY